jgi:hypothetical protein|tara:strand:- start:201 stop:425 length:225 start_codon:yes stop_codon:yes gene_type:complete
MVDNWIDCPHCAKNVISYPDECRNCGKDLRFLPDGSANPGQTNQHLKAFQIGGGPEKWYIAITIILFFLLMVLF